MEIRLKLQVIMMKAEISDKDIRNVFALCDEFLEEHSWELGVIAFDWAFRMKGKYNEETYQVFYGWLKKYIRGWGDCDDFGNTDSGNSA